MLENCMNADACVYLDAHVAGWLFLWSECTCCRLHFVYSLSDLVNAAAIGVPCVLRTPTAGT